MLIMGNLPITHSLSFLATNVFDKWTLFVFLSIMKQVWGLSFDTAIYGGMGLNCVAFVQTMDPHIVEAEYL